MKKRLMTIIIIVFSMVILFMAWWNVREYLYWDAKAEGYHIGYSIGYADSLNDIHQNSQMLANEIVQYETGSGKWKGFVMGFDSGYDAAQKDDTINN